MSQEDSIYEIATTDAWRHLLIMVEHMQAKFEKEVVSVVKRIDFSPTEAARCAGRVEAMEYMYERLRKIGKKVQQDG